MSKLIVIRIIPQLPTTADTFTTYLNPPAPLGPLKITAFDLTFDSVDNPSPGIEIGSASYIDITPSGGWLASDGSGFLPPQGALYSDSATPPNYPSGNVNGIIQQVDFVSTSFPHTFYELKSVATVMIEVDSPTTFENLRLQVEWGSQAIPLTVDFYDVNQPDGPAPDLSTWSPSAPPTEPDLWAQTAEQVTSLYLTLPVPPSATNPFALQLPADGTPPPFDQLLAAVNQILSTDPSGPVTATTTSPTAAGGTSLQFPVTTTGIAAGMSVSGTGISAGTVVVDVNPTGHPGQVDLSQEVLAAGVGSGVTITFTPNLALLSFDQCRNIAYEIVWSQQPPVPSPPEALEDIYTNPPNDGVLLSGSTPNANEGDRQQFEGQLKSYYAVPDTIADRLTDFVFALSAAVNAEQQSLSATQALVAFPANPGQSSTAPFTEAHVVLTAIGSVDSPTSFGVPAGYFYALAAMMPAQITAQLRYQIATGDKLARLLTDLTTAINAGTISDAEQFATLSPVPPPVSAAQAARRISALGVPPGSATPPAPLDTLELLTTADTPSGATLPFATTAGVAVNMLVSGAAIASGTTVSALSATSVTLSAPLLNDVPSGSNIVFTPPYSSGLKSLIHSWLQFPPAVGGHPSSQTYQPSDDDTTFWPSAAAAEPQDFLGLVLSALTQGFVIPPPFNVALGDKITAFLTTIVNPPTVATLAGVTVQLWTAFFQQNPTWLPPFTQPGNIAARIAAFVRSTQTFFDVATGGPPSSIDLATTADTSSGPVLQFAPTSAIVKGMSVSGLNIQPGTTVLTSPTTTATATSVTLSLSVSADVPLGTNIRFRSNLSTTATSGLPLLQEPSTDWLDQCLTAYGAFTFGAGFDVTKLRSAASTVFPSDPAAQEWLVDALVTIDALYQVMKSVMLSPLPNTPAYVFSIVEALYARGFKSAADITRLSGPDFHTAVTGTVAFGTSTVDVAGLIYTSASAIAPPSGSGGTSGGFQPINPDGSLTNCIPPPCFSPLGPIAYLQALLRVSEDGTCDNPFGSSFDLVTSDRTVAGKYTLFFDSTGGVAVGISVSGANIPANATVSAVDSGTVTLSQPVSGDVGSGTSVTFAAPSLGNAVAQRRGPIANLAATCANCDTPLPLIDIVNECLEFMGSLSIPTTGTVYDTSADVLAKHPLCHEEPCPEKDEKHCHEPCKIYAALPEYSTPGTPVTANQAVEPQVYNILKTDFSACRLPYSQALDVCRTYLRHFHSCRFEELRTFRKCITEFVLDPVNEPDGFQAHLWRYPVRIDIAIEYLGITPEEYALLFAGAAATPCAVPVDTGGGSQSNTGSGANKAAVATSSPLSSNAVRASVPGALAAWQLYGFPSPGDNQSWTGVAVQLPEFLRRTCLSYCEFFELWESGFVPFHNGTHEGDNQDGKFPRCEPCCLDKLRLAFPEGEGGIEQALLELAVFIRLWRKLRESCCFCYSFAQLRDICDVLHLFNGGVLNPDFIRQLAAFQIFRDHFHLDLEDRSDKPGAGAMDADRTHLLALWVGPTAKKWSWAVQQLLESIEHHAQRHHKRERRSPEFVKLLASNLDPLSQLAGFDPGSTSDNWHAVPTHTLRFAEVLAKIYASDFSVEEMFYLFTADDHLDGDDPFPLDEANEALDLPLDLPDEHPEFSLWHLRRKLLEVHVSEEDVHEWHWKRIEAALRDDFGFAAADILDFGRHFFPETLGHAGHHVESASRRFTSSLPSGSTSAPMWNTPVDGPFHYDEAAEELSTRIALNDRAVIAKLTHVHALNSDEQHAVQDLYFQPRAMLAAFALLFSDFSSAQRHLIEEREEKERWNYFRRQFVLCHRRSRIIAEHLTHHVASATGQKSPEGDAPAWVILRELYADENKATSSWEKDDGTPPSVTWTPPPLGSAFAALLGLTGTGLVAEYKLEGGSLIWREPSGPLSAWGMERDKENAPVPTVLPAMTTTLTPQQMKYVSVVNGFLMKDSSGAWLGGAQGFEVKWSGALLVDHDGAYEFWAGAPTAGEEKPDFEAAEHRRWRVLLKRGQRTWVLLSHHWHGEEEYRGTSLPLKRGAYEITIEFIQPEPQFSSDEQVRAQHTGFQIKYSGPDTRGERVEVPHSRLFAVLKDKPLGDGIAALGGGASTFLNRCYVSSLRDIRRTYQRAFKGVLFAHRFRLSGRRQEHGTSELGYMLAQGADFAGFGYFRDASGFKRHAVDFDFNFFPLLDNYHPPTYDQRTQPSPQRLQALVDCWERIFDYTVVRREVKECSDRHLWYLFSEAQEKHPAQPASLLRHMGADSRHWELDLRYYQGQSVPVYEVTSGDLEDDRWAVRAWHADRWLRALECFFTVKDITKARPDLWAADDPSALVAGETETGNANLSAFLCDGCFENGHPRRYEDVKRLNDGLRERARDALVSYLCHMNRVALPWPAGAFATTARDLSDLLLLDVETGLCERASRIDEAITAVQTFVRLARLHLVPGWHVGRAFARMWDREFATFPVWQACRRRHLYKENYIEWSDLEKARSVEAFRFLESKLRGAELTVAEPGGLEWWPNERPPEHETLKLLQKEPSSIEILPDAREGLNLVGAPERDARPSWLTAVPANVGSTGSNASQANRLAVTPATAGDVQLPFWMESAIRLGTRFYRVAAAGVPPAAMAFKPHHSPEEKDCVTCCEECGCCHPALVDEYYFWLIDGEFYDIPVTPAPSGFTVPSGDYQNGYQVDFYDPVQQESALWQDTNQLPQLLQWDASPMVRLGWCRVHNGEFQQPRKSHFGVPIQPGSDADLVFLGRTADSLIFSVTNAVPPQGNADPSAPGFRYDLASDDAVVLPLVTLPPTPPTFITLPAYPYFVFVAPGDSLFPISIFSPSLAVARALRSHCQFEAALNWYRLAFDPLQNDCAWVRCSEDTRANPGGGNNNPSTISIPASGSDTSPSVQLAPGPSPESACCDSTNITCDKARNRSVLLHYLETLVEWGEAVMRHCNSPEAFQQARVVFDAAGLILGRYPINVRLQPPSTSQTVTSFKPEFPPLNPRLLDLYTVVRDRVAMIHACLNSRRLYSAEGCHLHYFGSDPRCNGKMDYCAEESDWCHLRSPYRFMYLIQKAQEYASKAQELGAELLSAFEKGDAEYLASLRQGHEGELLALALQAKQDQWRDADWQVEALQKTKSTSQANLIYYNGLINSGPGGLINDEIQFQNLMSSAQSLRGTANITEGVGEGLRLIPDLVLGLAGFGGSPVSIAWIPLGTKIGQVLEAAARIMNNAAEINALNAQLDETNAGWERRLEDWTHQTQTLAIEIQQVERQILSAQRRRDQMLEDLNSHQRQIEQSAEVLNFLRDKFTAHDLYLFLQKETAALYAKTYDLAVYAARQAQHAFNLERGHTSRRFLPECAWDSLHDGLLAGERLSTALRHMEKAYADENVREYELTKHFSLRLHFPEEFLKLRATGCCEIELPEWMFDMDFPGHYMRRIKNVTLTIPCVTGPYTGVHCRLTLLSNKTRIHPWLKAPEHECCCRPEPCCSECGEEERLAREYEPCPDDPRVVRCYGAREAIATSTGQNDSGLFELNFNDERYLPFEYMGAVSCFRIELPRENNFFDMDTLSDLMLRLNYTAREGGVLLRRAANAYAQRHLPGDGWCFFDVCHEFPDAWQLFLDSAKAEEERSRRLKLRFDRKMFPFVPGSRDLSITEIAILFDAEPEDDCKCGCPEIEGCPCPHRAKPACQIIEFCREREEYGARKEHHALRDDSRRKEGYEHKEDYLKDKKREEYGERAEHREREAYGKRAGRGLREEPYELKERGDSYDRDADDCERRVRCVASEACPDLYLGMLDTRVGPVARGRNRTVEFRFPSRGGHVKRVFLLLRYTVEGRCDTLDKPLSRQLCRSRL